tara:strand:+ start:317 stop:691 length:375 start_codon:yes stop_codon:yes gene_type:complete
MRRSASEIIRNLEMRIARLENKSAKDAGGTFLEMLLEEGNDYLNKIKITSRRLNGFGAVDASIRSMRLDLTIGEDPNNPDHILVTFHSMGEDDYLAQKSFDAHALDPTDFERNVLRATNRLPAP